MAAKKKNKTDRIRIAGKFVSKKLEKDIKEFAENHNMTVEDFIKQNESDIEFYINNKSLDTSYYSDQMLKIINTHPYKIEVDYIKGLKNRNSLLRVIQNFNKDMRSRTGINIAEIIYFTSLKKKGNRLYVNITEIPLFLQAKDSDLVSISDDAEYIKLIFSSTNSKKKK